MLFNIELFRHFAARAYAKAEGHPYTLEEVQWVFEYYFWKYEQTFKKIHPNIRMEQIERIISAMPYLDSEVHGPLDIEAEDYKLLIDKHFKTQYRNCNYNINHFFSGDIRMLRFYEELY